MVIHGILGSRTQEPVVLDLLVYLFRFSGENLIVLRGRLANRRVSRSWVTRDPWMIVSKSIIALDLALTVVRLYVIKLTIIIWFLDKHLDP